jgi:hypothetical protein
MSQTYVPKELRDRVAAHARYRCGYCYTAEAIVGTPMEIEHLIPQCLGGPTSAASAMWWPTPTRGSRRWPKRCRHWLAQVGAALV